MGGVASAVVVELHPFRDQVGDFLDGLITPQPQLLVFHASPKSLDKHVVQKALNRGESYHQLRRAVAYANFGKLRFKTEYEQQIWGECSRLITNCIIFYNTTILSRLLDHAHRSGDKGWADRISRASPVAWQHINFYGRYEFGKPAQPIDVEKTVQELAQQFKK